MTHVCALSPYHYTTYQTCTLLQVCVSLPLPTITKDITYLDIHLLSVHYTYAYQTLQFRISSDNIIAYNLL